MTQFMTALSPMLINWRCQSFAPAKPSILFSSIMVLYPWGLLEINTFRACAFQIPTVWDAMHHSRGRMLLPWACFFVHIVSDDMHKLFAYERWYHICDAFAHCQDPNEHQSPGILLMFLELWWGVHYVCIGDFPGLPSAFKSITRPDKVNIPAHTHCWHSIHRQGPLMEGQEETGWAMTFTWTNNCSIGTLGWIDLGMVKHLHLQYLGTSHTFFYKYHLIYTVELLHIDYLLKWYLTQAGFSQGVNYRWFLKTVPAQGSTLLRLPLFLQRVSVNTHFKMKSVIAAPSKTSSWYQHIHLYI